MILSTHQKSKVFLVLLAKADNGGSDRGECCFSVALFCPVYLLPYTIFENILFHFFLLYIYIYIYNLTWISREKKSC